MNHVAMQIPSKIFRMIGTACKINQEEQIMKKSILYHDNAKIFQEMNKGVNAWKVRRDGWITLMKNEIQEEWLVDPRVIDQLESTGCLFQMTYKETQEVRESDRLSLYGVAPTVEDGFLSAPFTIQWDVTAGCNLRCKHCYSASSEKDRNELTLQESLRIVEEAYTIGVHSLHILGGEPFFQNDLISILTAACQHGLTCHVSSNGTLITEKKANELSSLEGLTVDVSVDSVDPIFHDWLRGNGTYHKAVSGIRHLVDAGIRFGTTCTVNPMTLDKMDQVVEQAIRMGAYRMQFLIVSPIGRALQYASDLVLTGEQRERFAHRLRELQIKHESHLIIDSPAVSGSSQESIDGSGFHKNFVLAGCMAGIDKMAIHADGSVVACPHLEEKYGNVREARLEEIWAKLHKKRIEQLGFGCSTVTFNGICGGECPAPNRDLHEIVICSGRENPNSDMLQFNRSKNTAKYPISGWCTEDCRCPFPCCPGHCSAPCQCPTDCHCPIPCCPADCNLPCRCPLPF